MPTVDVAISHGGHGREAKVEGTDVYVVHVIAEVVVQVVRRLHSYIHYHRSMASFVRTVELELGRFYKERKKCNNGKGVH